MGDGDFFRTRMGHTYYEHTLPELVRQLTRLNDLLERLIERVPPAEDEHDRRTTKGEAPR